MIALPKGQSSETTEGGSDSSQSSDDDDQIEEGELKRSPMSKIKVIKVSKKVISNDKKFKRFAQEQTKKLEEQPQAADASELK